MERLLAWYRVSSSVGAVTALVLANLVPLVGVLWLGWSIWTILTIYWLENGIVGFYNVLKMAAVSGLDKVAMIPFFVMHYGVFWLVHGLFVLTLPTFVPFGGELGELDTAVPPDSALAGPNVPSVVIAGIGLFISHGVSYLFNFMRGGERRRVTATQLMGAPYGRVVILHLTIIFGTFAVIMTGAQLGPLLILIALKTAVDLAFHLREHRERLPSTIALGE